MDINKIDDIVQDLDQPEFFPENYYIYKEFIENKGMTINPRIINKYNYDQHYSAILAIMLDAIETEYMNKYFIKLEWSEGQYCELSIPDYWINLIMWNPLIMAGEEIKPYHIFWDVAITRKNIKEYIDKFFIDKYTGTIDIIDLNNMIDDCIHRYLDSNNFSFYAANTINLEDFIMLMEQNKEFYDCLHAMIDKNVPLDQVKSIGMEYTKKAISIIKNSNHCLAPFFKSGEGINTKQFKEFGINIGTKPDGNGSAFPTIVNTNFIIGGCNDLLTYYLEAHSGRVAQIIIDNNVGDSGYFARLLGLNNIDTSIYPDPNYDCGTKNFVPFYIKDESRLKLINQRYYRLVENGMEYCITENDRHLVGKTILLRSPMTCASHAAGKGICYKCYGRLAHIIKLICAGKISAELLSSVLTQKMLSAKHLLEAAVKALTWCKEFLDFFYVEFNQIKCRNDVDFTGFKIIINADDIELISEDKDEFNETIQEFFIEKPNGDRIKIYTADNNPLFLSVDINTMIREMGYHTDDLDTREIILDLDKVTELKRPLFSVEISNNDLNRTLNRIKATINSKETANNTLGSILEKLLDTLDEGGLDLNSVHAETILSNQIRDSELILENVDWRIPNAHYQILPLKGALNNTSSITRRLEYEGIKSALYNPLSFKINGASSLDLFFMEQPQEFLSKNSTEIKETTFNDTDMEGRKIIMKRDRTKIKYKDRVLN